MASPVELLWRTLEELGEKELRKLHWLLQQDHSLRGFLAVPKSSLEGADREATVDVMVHTYGPHRAVLIMGHVLEKMHRNDLAQSLLEPHSGPPGELQYP